MVTISGHWSVVHHPLVIFHFTLDILLVCILQ